MRKWLKLLALLCAGTVSAGLLSGAAQGAGLSPVVADCNAHGQLTRSYSVPQLRNALASIPQDISEYSVCHDIIERALLAKIGTIRGSDSSGSGGGSFLPVWLIVVLAVLVLGGAGYGLLAWRRGSGATG